MFKAERNPFFNGLNRHQNLKPLETKRLENLMSNQKLEHPPLKFDFKRQVNGLELHLSWWPKKSC